MPKLSKSLNSHQALSTSSDIDKKYNPQDIKLPFVKLKKVLNKIGALTKRQTTFVPS